MKFAVGIMACIAMAFLFVDSPRRAATMASDTVSPMQIQEVPTLEEEVVSIKAAIDNLVTRQELQELEQRYAALEADVAAMKAANASLKAPKPAPVAAKPKKAVTVAVAPLVPARSRWTYPGQIDTHLLTEPKHAKELAARGINISGMSVREMENLHSALHENPPAKAVVVSSTQSCPGGVCPTNYTSTSVTYTQPAYTYSQPRAVYSSNCPGGVCPTSTPRTRVGLFGWRRR